MSLPRLLIISHDIVAEKMAGPGMRYLEMARALGGHLEVTLAVPSPAPLEWPAVRLKGYDPAHPGALKSLAAASQFVLISSFILAKFPFIERLPQRIVVDLYDPFVLENLHYYQSEPMEAQASLAARAVEIMNRLVARGDYFICGSERQRDFWVGVLAAGGRISPQAFAQDPSLRALIDVVGIGFPNRPPRPHPTLRSVHPAFPPDSRIVLWGGGMWDWLDPLTLVRAWPQVLAHHPQARLVFLGTRHPNPLVPRHKIVDQVEALAAASGQIERTIFFIQWLPYDEREGLLCEADVGVALHPLHIETRYAIRTRVLDYFWAHLPVLVTEGDVTSEWVQRYALGRVVPPLDVDAVALALCALLDQPKHAWSPAFTPLQEHFAWPLIVEPLRHYCLQPASAPVRRATPAWLDPAASFSAWKSLWARAGYIRRHEGGRALLQRLWRYFRLRR